MHSISRYTYTRSIGNSICKMDRHRPRMHLPACRQSLCSGERVVSPNPDSTVSGPRKQQAVEDVVDLPDSHNAGGLGLRRPPPLCKIHTLACRVSLLSAKFWGQLPREAGFGVAPQHARIGQRMLNFRGELFLQGE